jgi:hypothetical protein
LFCASVYVVPSSSNRPFAMRFAYRPVMLPKYGLLRST